MPKKESVVPIGATVRKIGGSTTRGIVVSTHVCFGPLHYDDGPYWFSGCLSVESVGEDLFAGPGDEGAIVVSDGTDDIVGEVFAVTGHRFHVSQSGTRAYRGGFFHGEGLPFNTLFQGKSSNSSELTVEESSIGLPRICVPLSLILDRDTRLKCLEPLIVDLRQGMAESRVRFHTKWAIRWHDIEFSVRAVGIVLSCFVEMHFDRVKRWLVIVLWGLGRSLVEWLRWF